MTPLLVLCAMVGFATVVGLFVVLLLRPTFIAKKKVNFQANSSALGFVPLRGPSAEWIGCGGEVRGRRFLLTPVERPSILPRWIDILSEAGWLRCAGCDHHRLVTFACKGRGFCPRCGGRRMAATSAWWIDRVLPHVATRQWVVTLPWKRRWLLARRPELASGVHTVALRTIERWYAAAGGAPKTGC